MTWIVMSTRHMRMLLGESSMLFVKVRTDFEKDDVAGLFIPTSNK